jgi:hypothetical protein
MTTQAAGKWNCRNNYKSLRAARVRRDVSIDGSGLMGQAVTDAQHCFQARAVDGNANGNAIVQPRVMDWRQPARERHKSRRTIAKTTARDSTTP